MIHQMRWISLISSGHSIQMQKNTHFSSAHRTFFRVHNIQGHKRSLSKFKKTEIISSIFSDHNAMEQKSTLRRKLKNINTWRLATMLLHNQGITEEIKEETFKIQKQMKIKNRMVQNLGNATKAVLNGRFIAIEAYRRKQEKSQINTLNLHLSEVK